MRSKILSVMLILVFTFSILFLGTQFQSNAQTQTQLIIDGSIGTIPNNLEPYCGTFSCILPINNLVGYWSLNDGSSSTAWDNSGNMNIGTLENSPTWISSGGLNFSSASSQYVTIPSYDLINITGDFTVSLWVNGLNWNSATNEGLINKGPFDGGFGYWSISLRGDDAIHFIIGDESAQFPLPSPNTWENIVGTYDNTYLKIYLNGTLQGQFAYSTPVVKGSGALIIGGYYSSSYTCTCEIKNVRIYNTVLNSTQISELYNNVASGNGYYSSTNNAFIYTQSQDQNVRLNQFTVDSSLASPIPNYNSSVLLSYTQSMTENHHWIFSYEPVTIATVITTTIPITHLMIVLWLLFCFIPSKNIYFILLTRIIAAIIGFIVGALGTYTGELWINISTAGVFSLSTFNDGFGVLWFWILIIGSIGMITTIIIEFMSFRKNPEANL